MSSFRKILSSFFHLHNHITNLKVQIAQLVVQAQANQVFHFPEVVKGLVIMSSEKETLEFSLHYIKVVIAQREGCPAHNLVKTSIFPTKETEFKQESHARFHIFLRREYLGKDIKTRED